MAIIAAVLGSFFRQIDGYKLYSGSLLYKVEDGPKDKAILQAI